MGPRQQTCSLLLVVCLALRQAHAVTRSISTDDSAFPFVVDLVSGKRMQWNTGRAAEYLASSPAVRVSARGIRFIHRFFTVNIANSDKTTCERSSRALCVDDADGRRVFPLDEARVAFVDGGRVAAHDSCAESFTGRVLSDVARSDISLCNVLSGAQHVLVENNNVLEVKTSALGPWLQAFLSILAVFVVGCIVNRVTNAKSHVTGSIACAIACTAIIALVVLTHDPERLYVTLEDEVSARAGALCDSSRQHVDVFFQQASFMVLLAYTLYNLGRFFVRALRATDTIHTPFSVCVGSLNLLSFRLFATMDNPCSPFIFAFVAACIMNKVRTGKFADSVLGSLDTVFDGVVVSLLGRFGFVPQYESEVKAAAHIAVLLTGLCALMALPP